MLKRSSFNIYSHTETFAPLINCVVDDALLETMPYINQALLRFIDVMNFLDPLLNFSPYLCALFIYMSTCFHSCYFVTFLDFLINI